MDFELYQEVVLIRNLSDTNFKKGDVATIVKIDDSGKKILLSLEFFSILGVSLGIFDVYSDFVQHLKPNGIVNMREM